MSKKIKLVELIAKVNDHNQHSKGVSPDARQAVNSLLEHFLHLNKKYAGYGYLAGSEVPKGELPGILTKETVTFPDDTRRFYYYHHSLIND